MGVDLEHRIRHCFGNLHFKSCLLEDRRKGKTNASLIINEQNPLSRCLRDHGAHRKIFTSLEKKAIIPAPKVGKKRGEGWESVSRSPLNCGNIAPESLPPITRNLQRPLKCRGRF